MCAFTVSLTWKLIGVRVCVWVCPCVVVCCDLTRCGFSGCSSLVTTLSVSSSCCSFPLAFLSCGSQLCVCVCAGVVCVLLCMRARVCVCGVTYSGPCVCVKPRGFDCARHPDGVSMDGGAWLPLRTRYLPRWHNSGSYQLYPGEQRVELAPVRWGLRRWAGPQGPSSMCLGPNLAKAKMLVFPHHLFIYLAVIEIQRFSLSFNEAFLKCSYQECKCWFYSLSCLKII